MSRKRKVLRTLSVDNGDQSEDGGSGSSLWTLTLDEHVLSACSVLFSSFASWCPQSCAFRFAVHLVKTWYNKTHTQFCATSKVFFLGGFQWKVSWKGIWKCNDVNQNCSAFSFSQKSWDLSHAVNDCSSLMGLVTFCADFWTKHCSHVTCSHQAHFFQLLRKHNQFEFIA